MIQVKNLSKRFGSHLAVDGITFGLEHGQILGFLGPNGAGKSTTIRILTCYMPATSGQARVAGFDVFTESMQVRRHIGYLPESTPLYPEMRVREYLTFRAKLHHLGPADRAKRAATVADRCSLHEFVNRPIGQLSKGMKQRVGLAAALISDPKLLILDEPTIGLDPTQIRETRKLIRELGEQHTILLSSHILHEVEQVCTEVIIIASGRIVASGTPEALRARIGTGSRLIAEIRGPAEEVRTGVGQIAGVRTVQVQAAVAPAAAGGWIPRMNSGAPGAADGWQRLSVGADSGSDVREDIFQLAGRRGWSMREIRREVASLEDYFVKITAEQQSASP